MAAAAAAAAAAAGCHGGSRPSIRQVQVAAPAGSAAAGADPSYDAARLMPTGPAGLCLCGQGSQLQGFLRGSLGRKLGRALCAPAQGASRDSTAGRRQDRVVGEV